MRLGTRGSALALAQARLAAAALGGEDAGVEIVVVETRGDRDRAALDKAKWVSELERALLDGEVDAAVHSAKDVPSVLADGCELVGTLAREDPRDVLVGAGSLDELAPGARVGTASLRRAAQLRARREDLEVVEVRGNVDTRLRKLAEGEADALVLAAAGLARLGREETAVPLDTVPAAGQGVVVIEARAGTPWPASDEDAWARLAAERACVAVLGADCHSAVGAHAERDEDGGLTLRAWAGLPDGSAWVEDEQSGDDASELGRRVAERLLAAGAGNFLKEPKGAWHL
jgi:hydroxymethylbilane synthase